MSCESPGPGPIRRNGSSEQHNARRLVMHKMSRIDRSHYGLCCIRSTSSSNVVEPVEVYHGGMQVVR